jgi:SAM-dependent methyltransferase
MGEAYSDFAEVYDELMDNIPYPEWSRYLCSLLAEYNIQDGLVAELGCGTGTITELLSEAGYDMIGIDNSPEMLEAAIEKRDQNASTALYLCQDMREFELYGTVRAVVSLCDSINYITEPKELAEVFRLVNNYLDPGGIFIFDFHPEHYYRNTVGERTIAEAREDVSFIWENYYDRKTRINELDLTLFLPVFGDDPELYRKREEVHYQYGYTLEDMKALLQEAGLTFLTAYDAFTRNAPTADSERIYVIARECGK